MPENKPTKESPNLRLVQALATMPSIPKNRTNKFLGNKYYNVDDMDSVVKPHLAKYGLGFTQPVVNLVCPIKGIIPALHSFVFDSESKAIMLEGTCPLDFTGKTDQGVGGTISYYRRYCGAALLTLEGEDDDGNLSSGIVPGGIADTKSTSSKTGKTSKSVTPVDVEEEPFPDSPVPEPVIKSQRR
jgi:hypothetical protein